MFPTSTSYRLIASDLNDALQRTVAQPDVKRASEYYLSKISEIDTVEQFLADDRIYQYAMRAHGLEDMIYGKAFMRKVLTEGIDDRQSFANSLVDKRFRDFAETFNFARYGGTATSFTKAQQGTVDAYIRQTLEVSAGESDEGVRLALYFQRKAPTVDNAFSLLADRALLKVTQIALGFSASTGSLDVERQAEMIASKLDVADFQTPEKLDKFIARFTALWEIENPQDSSRIPANLGLSSQSGLFDMDLLGKIQNLKIGR